MLITAKKDLEEANQKVIDIYTNIATARNKHILFISFSALNLIFIE